jgi:hypothetical protein
MFTISPVDRRKNKKLLFFWAIVPIVIAGVVFVLRPPVLLVTDRGYDQLYGIFRGKRAQAEASIRLFRRVKTVRIADTAGPDVAVFAIKSASKKPFCVLFPYRYYREAEQYAQDSPEIPAAVLLGRIREVPPNMTLPGIRTDTEGDYFKMGLAAAFFVQSRAAVNGGEEPPGKILFFRDDLVSPEDAAAFQGGLLAGEYPLGPVEVRSGSDYTIPGDAACAVLTGAAESFLNQNLSLPVFLFSWLDPGLTHMAVKIIFDDSPWPQVVPAVATAAGKRENEGIPSKVLFLGKRIEEKEFLRKAKGTFRKTGNVRDLSLDL